MIDNINNDPSTDLWRAINALDIEGVKQAIENGADINKRSGNTPNADTPLHTACRWIGDHEKEKFATELVYLLVNNKDNVLKINSKTFHGSSVMDLFLSVYDQTTGEWTYHIPDLQIFILLVNKEAKVEEKHLFTWRSNCHKQSWIYAAYYKQYPEKPLNCDVIYRLSRMFDKGDDNAANVLEHFYPKIDQELISQLKNHISPQPWEFCLKVFGAHEMNAIEKYIPDTIAPRWEVAPSMLGSTTINHYQLKDMMPPDHH